MADAAAQAKPARGGRRVIPSGFVNWRMSSSENRFPHFRDMR
jgi:hypothetical protein